MERLVDGKVESGEHAIPDISEMPQDLRDFVDYQPMAFINCEEDINEDPIGAEAASPGSNEEAVRRVSVPSLLLESSSDDSESRLIKNFAYRLMKFNSAVFKFCESVRVLSYEQTSLKTLDWSEKIRMEHYYKSLSFSQYVAALSEIRTFVSNENFLLKLGLLHNHPDILDLFFINMENCMDKIDVIVDVEEDMWVQEACDYNYFEDFDYDNCILQSTRPALAYSQIFLKIYDIMRDYQAIIKNTDNGKRQIASQELLKKINENITIAETIRQRIDQATSDSLIPPEVEMTREPTQSILRSKSKEGSQKEVRIGCVEYRDDLEGTPTSWTFNPEEYERYRRIEILARPGRKDICRERKIVDKSPEVARLTKDYPGKNAVMRD